MIYDLLTVSHDHHVTLSNECNDVASVTSQTDPNSHLDKLLLDASDGGNATVHQTCSNNREILQSFS